MLPNLIFLFNLSDVIPLDVRLCKDGAGMQDIARFRDFWSAWAASPWVLFSSGPISMLPFKFCNCGVFHFWYISSSSARSSIAIEIITAFLIYSSGFKLFFVVFHITWRLDKKIKANCRASSDDTECNSEALQQVDLLSAQLCGNKKSLAVFSGTLSSIKLICALF